MATKIKMQKYTSLELNRMSNKGVAAGMVLQPCFAMRVVKAKKRDVPARKMKHKHSLFGE